MRQEVISGRRTFISNEGQTMPQNINDWNIFLIMVRVKPD